MAGVFRELCHPTVEDNDGIEFMADSVRAVPIREEQVYDGIRVTLMGMLHQARIPLQVDIGFGDAVTPEPERVEFPTLLDAPPPKLLAYPSYTMVSEKAEAIVRLGMANSRMKDFYDLYILARDFAFDGAILTRAIQATFKRRHTEIPREPPLALTEEFGRDDTKSVQWEGFIRKGGLEQGVPELPDILLHLREFLLPPLKAASGTAPVPKKWSTGGSWVFAKSEIGEM
jgi:hypothetical protein